MNRREHYIEAEKLLDDLKAAREKIEGISMDPVLANHLNLSFTLQATIAGAHAALAGVPDGVVTVAMANKAADR